MDRSYVPQKSSLVPSLKLQRHTDGGQGPPYSASSRIRRARPSYAKASAGKAEQLESIPHPELDRLGARHLLVTQEIKQQLQFGLFEEFAFYRNDLANANEPAL
jgi:hypothetical protein